MAGAVLIVVWLLLLPVLILLGGAVGAVVLGNLLTRDAEDSHDGSELVELNS